MELRQMSMGKEIWLPVVGYEELYEVSNIGRVKVLYREWVAGNYNSKRKINEHIIKPILNRYGYNTINIRKNGNKQVNVKIHRLVAMAFIENTENKPQVNHKNGNKLDNTVENLEWVTRQENVAHSYKMGLQIGVRSGKHGQARLVLNTETGIFYECINDAANSIGGGTNNYNKLYRQLTGWHRNVSNFILA